MQFLEPHPRLTESGFLCAGPRECVFPPGAFSASPLRKLGCCEHGPSSRFLPATAENSSEKECVYRERFPSFVPAARRLCFRVPENTEQKLITAEPSIESLTVLDVGGRRLFLFKKNILHIVIQLFPFESTCKYPGGGTNTRNSL